MIDPENIFSQPMGSKEGQYLDDTFVGIFNKGMIPQSLCDYVCVSRGNDLNDLIS